MKAVYCLGITALTQISRLRFKQSRISLLITHIYVLGRFFYGNRNFEDLVLF